MAAPRSGAPTTTPESTSGARSPRRRGAATPEEFLAHIRAGRAERARRAGQRRQVDPRRDGAGDPVARGAARPSARPDPAAVLKIVERVMREGDVRHGHGRRRPRARGRPRAAARLARRRWTSTSTSATCSSCSRRASSATPDLYRRARRIHERKLAAAVAEVVAMADGRRELELARGGARAVRRLRPGDPLRGRDRVPRPREAQADPQRRRSAAGRAGRRRTRRHARRHPHDPADPRPRRARASRSR